MVETRAGGIAKTDLGNIKEDIIAAVDETYDLGSNDKKWAYIWVAIAMVTSITIGGVIGISNVDSWLFINASTEVNGSMNISEDLLVNGTITAGALDIQNLSVENMNFTNLTITGDIFNISTTETYVNDLFPNEYCTSDLGSIGLRWDNGYFCHNVSAEYFVGDGSYLTNIPPGTEVDPFWTGNYTAYNSSWTSTYNATYDAYNSTGLIINWSGNYLTSESDPYWLANYSVFLTISSWNDTGLIQDWNSTGLIINWSGNYLTSELDPYWTGNQSSYFNTTDILGFSYYNSTDFDISDYLLISNWNSTNESYYLTTNPSGFYNSTDFDIADYLLIANWNSTNTSYYLTTNPSGFWNDTFATFNKTYADTLYSTILEPLWSANYTAYNSSWTSTYNSTYDAKVSFPDWDSNLAWQNQTNIFTENQNLTSVNISAMDCIIFDSGGKICSGV